MIDDAYRDKIRNAAWLAIVEASMTTGPDGTKVAVLKSGEIIEALLWLQATMLTTTPGTSTSDGLRHCSGQIAKRLRALTRDMRREGAALLFDVMPTTSH
jgi:hypothetical protein